jgi:hypothetical protein
MDETIEPKTPVDSPRPARDLDSWRGDISDNPQKKWRRRPRAQRVRELWKAAQPLIASIGEGSSWE